MNLLHHWICRSEYWKRTLETELLPWAIEGLDLGPDVLEIGPGYGVGTGALRNRVFSIADEPTKSPRLSARGRTAGVIGFIAHSA